MKTVIIVFTVLIFGVACNRQKYELAVKAEIFENVLNIQAIPQKPLDLDAFGFSDCGAWHAYSLPHLDSANYHGGFCGPLLMKMHGQWMGKCVHRIVLADEKGTEIPYNPQKVKLMYLPGRLVQELDAQGIQVKVQLIFTGERTALIAAEITNSTHFDRNLGIQLEGDIWLEDLKLQKIDQQLRFILPDGSLVSTVFQNKDFSFHCVQGKLNINLGNLSLRSKETKQLSFYQSYCFDEQELSGNLSHDRIKELFQENSDRWNQYLNAVVNENMSEEEKRLLVKCVQTLISNWRSPGGALKHNGVFPSAAYQGFYGFWSWDSWKHAVALSRFYPFLAKESIRSMFDFQSDSGMVADCAYFDPKGNNWRDTKAPLSAWAVCEVFRETADTAFVTEMYSKLVKYHEWWYGNRDNNKNGLCEYGSTDGTLIAAKWESGMDNAVRFDDAKIVKVHDSAWSLNQESVDLNAYLQKEKEYLSFLADVIDEADDSEKYKNEAQELAGRIREYFWCEEAGYFFDKNTETGDFVMISGPEGWTPLWTKLASKRQAAEVVKTMMDSTRFNTKVPFPTLDASHECFNPLKGYWRGPVWIDQACFAIQGLRNYGFNSQANLMTEKLLQNADGLLQDAPIRENYHPITGEGLNANHFSWSAAHLLMLLESNINQ